MGTSQIYAVRHVGSGWWRYDVVRVTSVGWPAVTFQLGHDFHEWRHIGVLKVVTNASWIFGNGVITGNVNSGVVNLNNRLPVCK